jgi:hypothetical protein
MHADLWNYCSSITDYYLFASFNTFSVFVTLFSHGNVHIHLLFAYLLFILSMQLNFA